MLTLRIQNNGDDTIVVIVIPHSSVSCACHVTDCNSLPLAHSVVHGAGAMISLLFVGTGRVVVCGH